MHGQRKDMNNHLPAYKIHLYGQAKGITVANYVIAGILWLLGILTLLLNIIGVFKAWVLICWAVIFYAPIPALFEIPALYISFKNRAKKYILLNLLALGISVAVVLFTLFVSARWFW